jgi:hypothetical protein
VAGAATVIYGWWLGHTVWWLAVAALGVVFRTLGAVGAVRRYKAWAARFEAMGRVGGAPPPASKPHPWMRGMGIVAALITIPIVSALPTMQYNPNLSIALHWAWGLLALYSLYRVLRVLWHRAGRVMDRRRQVRIAKSLDEPISIALGSVGGSPTRASIERNLPNYCEKLLQNGG